MEGKTNFLSMFSDEEERRLLLRLVGTHASILPPLNQGDFQRPAHRLIWKALVSLAYQELEISPRAAAACLERMDGGATLAKAYIEALRILGFGG